MTLATAGDRLSNQIFFGTPPGRSNNSRNPHRKTQLCESFPNDGVTALRTRLPGVYAWLYRHDREWLKEHQPNRKIPLPVSRVDWSERDKSIINEAELIVQSLIDSEERPVRITPTTIARKMGLLARMENNRDKLPLTCAYLESISETREKYAQRRIWWVIEECRHQGVVPPIW